MIGDTEVVFPSISILKQKYQTKVTCNVLFAKCYHFPSDFVQKDHCGIGASNVYLSHFYENPPVSFCSFIDFPTFPCT